MGLSWSGLIDLPAVVTPRRFPPPWTVGQTPRCLDVLSFSYSTPAEPTDGWSNGNRHRKAAIHLRARGSDSRVASRGAVEAACR